LLNPARGGIGAQARQTTGLAQPIFISVALATEKVLQL